MADPGRCLLRVIPSLKEFAARRPNQGSVSPGNEPDGCRIWKANEVALPADGPVATAGGGTVIRLVRLAIPNADEKATE